MSARVADMRKSSIGYTVLSYGGVDRDYARMDNNLPNLYTWHDSQDRFRFPSNHSNSEFLMQCELVFKLQPSSYRSDEERNGYIISYMTGSPQRAMVNICRYTSCLWCA